MIQVVMGVFLAQEAGVVQFFSCCRLFFVSSDGLEVCTMCVFEGK